MKKIVKRIVSFVLALAMVLTLIQTTPFAGESVKAEETTQVRIHFKNEMNWSTVNMKFGGGSNWDPVSGYESFKTNEYGCEIESDANNDGWYTKYLTIPSTVTEINGLFDNGSWGGGNQTSNFRVSTTSNTEVWITYEANNGDNLADPSTTAPTGWVRPSGETAFSTDAEDSNDDTEEVAVKDVRIIVHLQKPASWDAVYAHVREGSSWNLISGYNYIGEWPGAAIEADTNNSGWYSFEVTKSNSSEFHCIFNNGCGSQLSNVDLTASQIANGYEVWQSADGSLSTTAPSGWTSQTSYPAPINPNAGSTLQSPVINGSSVTFNLDATGTYKDATSVKLMGTVPGTSWNSDTALSMSKSSDGSVWTITIDNVAAGTYEYKFLVGTDGWMTDPLNNETSNGNSKLVVPSAEDASVASPVVSGSSVTFNLDATGTYKDATKVQLMGTVTGTSWNPDTALEMSKSSDGKLWTITINNLAAGTYSYKFLVDGSWINDPLNTTNYDTDGNNTVAVTGVYTYNIYFHDDTEAHMAVDAAEIWAWEVGGGNLDPIAFTSVETIDGSKWLKATLNTTATNLGLIPRSKGAWDWQTANHYYDNSESKNVTNDIYIVMGDSNTYTSVPTIKASRQRYLIVEYNRTNNDYDGWNIYSWNSGFGSSTEIYSQEVNGKHYIIVPVADSSADMNVSFCMRYTTTDDEWAAKDGGDHSVLFPADQTVVHAVFDQGQGVTKVYPYNAGYEMQGSQGQIQFYYRDDSLIATNTEASLGTVKVMVNGQSYDMTYSADNERYEASVTCASGTYAYYYVVNGTKVLDAYNSNTITYNNEECSVLSFKTIADLDWTVSLSQSEMNYNDNNVLSVALNGTELATSEIRSLTADLSELGLGTMDIDTALMKVSIAVTTSVTTGSKNIPVTLTDIYGNTFTKNVAVTVTNRDADTFDWDEAVIYFAVTDRFFDGNTSNDSGVNKDGTLSYHGGDFAGVNQKLDYLQDLGVNTIWITPIVENSDTTTEDADGNEIESTGYHGYWASDFTTLNSHLGTEEEFQALVDAVHAHGMKLMVDVVINHAGYSNESEGFDVEDTFNTILTDEEGNYVSMIRDSANTVSNSDILSSLSGLPDFMTENEAVRNQLIEWQVNWVEKYGIDYYRVDTVKHVDSTTWEAFKNALTSVDPDFKMIGEYSGAGASNNFGALGTGGMDSLLDFDYNDQAEAFVNGSITSVESFLESRNAKLNNTATLGAFLSSHDENGLVYKLINSDGMTEETALNKFKVAASLELTSKGQVVIYYGEEIGLYGADNYPIQSNRYDYDWEEAAAQASDDSSMLNHYKKMLAIRNQYSKLFARGNREQVLASDTDGYLVFERSLDDDSLYIGLNIADAEQTVTIPVDAKAGSQMKDLYSGTVYTVSDDATVTVTLPTAAAGGTVVLAKYSVPAAVVTPSVPVIRETIQNVANTVANTLQNALQNITNRITRRTAKKNANTVTVNDEKTALSDGNNAGDATAVDAAQTTEETAQAELADEETALAAETSTFPIVPFVATIFALAAIAAVVAFMMSRKKQTSRIDD